MCVKDADIMCVCDTHHVSSLTPPHGPACHTSHPPSPISPCTKISLGFLFSFDVDTQDTLKGGLSVEASMAECPEALRPYIFQDTNGTPRRIIPYHRIRPFQMCSLKLIARELLR